MSINFKPGVNLFKIPDITLLKLYQNIELCLDVVNIYSERFPLRQYVFPFFSNWVVFYEPNYLGEGSFLSPPINFLLTESGLRVYSGKFKKSQGFQFPLSSLNLSEGGDKKAPPPSGIRVKIK